MELIPAIDIRGGQCVRLWQGDFARETVYDADPTATARRWIEQGATRLHVVDLDGARKGEPVNLDALRAIAAAARSASAACQWGGGVRSEEHLRLGFELGMDRLVVGTRALHDPAWLAAMADQFPGRLLLGIDAHNGTVATHGWRETSPVSAVELAKRHEHLLLAGVIYTDIARDGTLAGPNLAALTEMAAAVRLPVIASGGVSSAEDLQALARLPLAGVIVGRALYEGKLSLAQSP